MVGLGEQPIASADGIAAEALGEPADGSADGSGLFRRLESNRVTDANGARLDDVGVHTEAPLAVL